MRSKFVFIFTLGMIFLTGCVSYDFSRPIVQQGNLLPDNKIERLRVGISKEETRILMGTSLVSPMFSRDRWDYAYTLQNRGGPIEVRHVSLYFKADRLTTIDAPAPGQALRHP